VKCKIAGCEEEGFDFEGRASKKELKTEGKRKSLDVRMDGKRK
jgi:hypothetical protein